MPVEVAGRGDLGGAERLRGRRAGRADQGVPGGWTDFLVTRKPEILEQILKQKAISPELAAELKAAAAQFKETWK